MFKIGGNKYRPIAAVHYHKHDKDGNNVEGRVYVRNVLTHRAYDNCLGGSVGAVRSISEATTQINGRGASRRDVGLSPTPNCLEYPQARLLQIL